MVMNEIRGEEVRSCEQHRNFCAVERVLDFLRPFRASRYLLIGPRIQYGDALKRLQMNAQGIQKLLVAMAVLIKTPGASCVGAIEIIPLSSLVLRTSSGLVRSSSSTTPR